MVAAPSVGVTTEIKKPAARLFKEDPRAWVMKVQYNLKVQQLDDFVFKYDDFISNLTD